MRLVRTAYSKVNKLQMRLPYQRIYSNTVYNMKKTQNKLTQLNIALTSKNRFLDTHTVIFAVI